MGWQDSFDKIREATHNPLVPLSLEVFGDDANQLAREFDKICGTDSGNLIRTPWVARITGLDPKFKFRREFERFDKDYSQANSKGSRGITQNYWLNSGVFDVFERTSWRGSRRYFIRISAGKISEITEQEVLQWLEENCSA